MLNFYAKAIRQGAWSHSRPIVVVLTLVAFMVGLVGPATAASTPPHDSSGFLLEQPSPEQRVTAMKNLAAAKSSDPTGFDQRMHMLDRATVLTQYLSSFPGFDPKLQEEFVAASMPTSALAGLIEITNSGELKLESTRTFYGVPSVKLAHAAPTIRMMAGGLHTASVQPLDLSLPRCGSAWAAFWAWFSSSTLICEALGFFGPWTATGCYLVMALGGSAMDFNRGC